MNIVFSSKGCPAAAWRVRQPYRHDSIVTAAPFALLTWIKREARSIAGLNDPLPKSRQMAGSNSCSTPPYVVQF